MFRSEKDDPPLPRNAAPYSGAVTWLRSLRSRIMGQPPLRSSLNLKSGDLCRPKAKRCQPALCMAHVIQHSRSTAGASGASARVP